MLRSDANSGPFWLQVHARKIAGEDGIWANIGFAIDELLIRLRALPERILEGESEIVLRQDKERIRS
ncbi:hypothetical protein ACFPYJ_19330 [Paenibacillus solisilvae]|uniref:Uncharacterized protein n=1 Tax=Paenibacillus solisilvae TaxID=2486751 RepID=A0ABW0W2F6_9BACL